MDDQTRALYQEILSELYRRMAQDPRIRAALKRIEAGKATLADTALVNGRSADILGDIYGDRITEIPEELRESLTTALLRERYDYTNDMCTEVQEALDAKNGIALQPQRAPFPAERVQQIAHSLLDPTVAAEVIERRARAAVPTTVKSMHDDFVKTNARIRNDLGLKCYISRVASPGCCAWCSKIAGRYTYGDQPNDVFRRHDNCPCTVTFENGRQRQDVWSKRKWNDTDPQEVERLAPKPAVYSQEEAQRIEEQQTAQFIGLTSGKKRGKIGTEEHVSIWDKIKSALSGNAKQSKILQQEIEEALKEIGFKGVDASFFKKVDKQMQLSIVDQLKILEDRFHAIGNSARPIIIADQKGDAVASVRYPFSNPDDQRLRLSATLFKSRQKHISARLNELDKHYCMPCNEDDETLSRYVVTHEYGHMLENIIAAQDMKGTIYTHRHLTGLYKDQIEKIARELDDHYDQNKSLILSDYGSGNNLDFFAECFANSQLGKPNVLGQAMQIWLERRGF